MFFFYLFFTDNPMATKIGIKYWHSKSANEDDDWAGAVGVDAEEEGPEGFFSGFFGIRVGGGSPLHVFSKKPTQKWI